VGRSLCVHVMISELKLRLSRRTGRHKPEYVRLTLAAMQTAIFFYRNGADSEPLLWCSHERKQHDEPEPTRPAGSSAGPEARSATRGRLETGPAEPGSWQGQ